MKIKPYLVFVLVLMFSFSVFGQDKPKLKILFWNTETTCDRKNSDVIESDILLCDSYIVNGEIVRTIYLNGLFYAISFIDDGDNIVADVYLKNNSGERVLIDVTKSAVIYYKNEQEFLSGGKPVAQAFSIPPKVIASKILNRSRWANALAGFAANMQQQTTTVESRDSRGNVVRSTVTSPDTQARNKSDSQIRNRNSSANVKAQNILAGAIQDNTVFDQSDISGLIYFKRHKKATYNMFYLKVDNKLFLFTFNK